MVGRRKMPEFELADLTLLAPAALDALLEEENTAWREELDWDFSATGGLVRRFAASHMLSGYALLAHGMAAGYCYSVIDNHKGLIGDLYLCRALRDDRAEGLLLEATVRRLMLSHQVTRIESQLMLLENASSRQLPAPEFACIYERCFMMAELGAIHLKPLRLRADAHIGQWSQWRQPEVAAMIAAAYRNHIDSQINDQYRTAAGARRFLMNIVDYPGCGAFFAPASFLAFHTRTSAVCGACLASLVAAHTGHITQVCVEPAMQGTGLGYELMRRSLDALAAHGCSRAGLTVTCANRAALALYERMGFAVRRRFAAYVWDGF